MTVKELKEILERYDENQEVVFRPYNSSYVYRPVNYSTKEIRKFWGADTEGLVILAEQTGSI